MAARSVLNEIRQELASFVGTNVKLRANGGRKKIIERQGILENLYPNLFVVKIKENSSERRISYTYTDILTSNVVLTVNADGEEMLFHQN